jgi:hypothetical protein
MATKFKMANKTKFVYVAKTTLVPLKLLAKAQAKHTEIVYKLTLFCCCCFANKSQTTTWKKPK